VDEYDVVVVGSGSAGAVLAARLSENPGRSVALLEAGDVYDRIEQFPSSVLDPSNFSESLPGAPHNWALPGTLLPGLQVPVARGKVMGGSSSINGAYFQRGTRDNFETWVKLGNDAWSYNQVLPYYKRSETDLDFTGDIHGTEGPIQVHRESPDRSPQFTGAFTAACHELGFADELDKNAGGPGGVGPVPMNVHKGRRVSTAIGYLLPALSRPNLRVIGNAYARRALFEGSRCVGVEADVKGERHVFRAAQVILSSGALRSPQLLMLSGIGPAAHMRENGIEVLVDLPGVGQNLMDHPELSVQWDISGKLPAMPGRGVLTSALNWTAEGSDQSDDLEILPFVCTTGDMLKVSSMARHPAKALGAVLRTSPRFVIEQAKAMRRPFTVIGLQQEDSRGTVKLASADPAQPPALNWNLLSEENDRRRLREAIRVTSEIFNSPAMRSAKIRAVNLDKSDLASNQTIDEWATKHIFATGHPSCTCRMGPQSDENAVVDQYGCVYGVDGLRVADTSIFPKLPSRGPNATAIMVGERISDFIDQASH
jgi:choline dehydrogenase